ncbi:hypothetical protein JEHA107958_03745 [Jeotgalicoccus halotolerans]|uniref:Uncharacterized protein n=1 Tax=Jeotgalicoccus halotolerans TaxID=157227 RepID=A0A3E0AYQ3_9STAP|nr:hypothetical protein DFR63_1169 [Jeotgalicoccus halotolerans]
METLTTILGISMVLLALASLSLLALEIITKSPEHRSFRLANISGLTAFLCLIVFLVLINFLV